MAHLSEKLKASFRSLALVAMATNQKQESAQNLYACWRTTQHTWVVHKPAESAL